MNRRSLFKTLAAAMIPAPLLAKAAPKTVEMPSKVARFGIAYGANKNQHVYPHGVADYDKFRDSHRWPKNSGTQHCRRTVQYDKDGRVVQEILHNPVHLKELPTLAPTDAWHKGTTRWKSGFYANPHV